MLAADRSRLAKQAGADRAAGDASALYHAQEQGLAVEAKLEENATQIDRLALRSPVKGQVLTHRMEDWKGQFVRKSTTLARIGDRGRLLAEIPVSERLLTDLRIGAPVVAQLRARPGTLLHGSIVAISPAAQFLPETAGGKAESIRPPEIPDRFVATARLDNPDGWALPGMSGRVKILLDRTAYLSRAWRVLRWWAQRIVWW
jgi:multidrug resistance efflux pump